MATEDKGQCPKAILITPAYNEEETIATIAESGLRMVREGVVADFLVIDDGSADRTANIAEKMGAKVMRIGKNAGKGNAFLQGALYCKRSGADVLVIVDADILEPLKSETVKKMILGVGARGENGQVIGMVICPAIEEQNWIGWDISGQRAISMKALNFLFGVENAELCKSKPAKRFEKMAMGYGLERALNYAITGKMLSAGHTWTHCGRLAFLEEEDMIRFKRSYRTDGGRDVRQKDEAERTRIMIAKRADHARRLVKIRKVKWVGRTLARVMAKF
ncbi:Glycosyltransferase AglJ [Candidatus Anstonella stagnisolia]|nr:Glycosyltransferase AglJ [Candidatus Anstonella stagnisolia]